MATEVFPDREIHEVPDPDQQAENLRIYITRYFTGEGIDEGKAQEIANHLMAVGVKSVGDFWHAGLDSTRYARLDEDNIDQTN